MAEAEMEGVVTVSATTLADLQITVAIVEVGDDVEAKSLDLATVNLLILFCSHFCFFSQPTFVQLLASYSTLPLPFF